jgi:hypothetical protein
MYAYVCIFGASFFAVFVSLVHIVLTKPKPSYAYICIFGASFFAVFPLHIRFPFLPTGVEIEYD